MATVYAAAKCSRARQGHKMFMAVPSLQASLEFHQIFNELIGRCYVLRGLGELAIAQGHFIQASEYLEEALAITQKMGSPWIVGLILDHLGTLARIRGNFTEAARASSRKLEGSY